MATMLYSDRGYLNRRMFCQGRRRLSGVLSATLKLRSHQEISIDGLPVTRPESAFSLLFAV